tara:strand:- start:896 stop:1654 length:759 start_codon:yes stop_codon:yes gene_type:complete
MKYLLLLPFLFSIGSFAQDAENRYEPVVNKAEYYIGSYKNGKDLDDMVMWYNKFAAWAEDQGDVYDGMTVALLTPYFNNDMSALDVVWVSNWPSPVEQFKGLETWVTGGGDKLLKSLPSKNSSQVDAWQWTISDPAELGVGDLMYATYSDCSNSDGYNNNSVYDLYMDFANMVKEDGDTIGRKMIVPNAGRALPEGVDFIRLMYTASISETGANQALYDDNFKDRQETKDLQASFSCTNARTYTGLVMRVQE